MKTKNLVLTVLILLLALVSMTAGYLLFAKRSELSSGWTKMTTAINRSSAELDRNSGSKYAEKLTPENLRPFDVSKLEKNLSKYQEQIRRVSENRNKLVAALAGIALQSELTGVSESDLSNVGTTESNARKVEKGFDTALELRNRNFSQIISLSKTHLGADIAMDGLVAGNSSAFAPAEKAVSAIHARNRCYESTLKDVSVLVDVPAAFGSQYQASARNIAETVDRLRANDNELRQQLAQLRQDNEARRQAIAKNSASSVELDRAIAQKKESVKSYKERLGISPDADPIPWKSGSKEVRSALVGRIIGVNADHGFVAIDLGTDTIVRQPMGKGYVAVNPRIVKGTNVVIYRGRGKDGRTVARLVLNEVGANVSTANITSETPALKVGDLVRCEFIN